MEDLNAQNFKTEHLLISIKINDVQKLNTLLLDGNLNLEAMDENGNTPLLLAAFYGHDHCVEALLNTGAANYKHINFLGQNAATLATYAGSKPCIRLLLSKWSYMDYTENCLVPPICVAAMRGHLHLIKFFYNFFPRPDSIRTVHSASPKLLAIAHGHYHIVEFINQHANNCNEASKTVLHRGRLNSKG